MRLLQKASEQGNVDSLRLMGDYHYMGLGVATVDYGQAAKFYLQATTNRNAQSMFNLGLMHEDGVGLPQDFDLAKRYYDQAVETEETAIVPVKLALMKLWIHVFYHHAMLWWSGEEGGATPSPSASPSASPSPSPKKTPSSASKSKGGYIKKLVNTAIAQMTEDVEDIVLVSLCLLLAVLVYFRSRQR
jgi:TPR repeat protein